MTDTLLAFDDGQVSEIAQMLRDWKNGRFTSQPPVYKSLPAPIETLIGLAISPITSLEGIEPGSGEVALYQVDLTQEPPTLLELDNTITVYSMMSGTVAEGDWVLLTRDAFSGLYFVINQCTSSGCQPFVEDAECVSGIGLVVSKKAFVWDGGCMTVVDSCEIGYSGSGDSGNSGDNEDNEDCTNGISRASLGVASTTSNQTSLSMSVTVQGMLFVNVALSGNAPTGISSITFNGTTCQIFSLSSISNTNIIYIAYLHVGAMTTGTIVVTADTSVAIAISAVEVICLANNAQDQHAEFATGTSNLADTGASGMTLVADEYAQCLFLYTGSSGSPTFGGGFTAGQVVTFTGDFGTVTLYEGSQILSATQTVDATLSLIATPTWAACVGTWK